MQVVALALSKMRKMCKLCATVCVLLLQMPFEICCRWALSYTLFLKILTMITDIWRKTIKFVFGKFCANCAY